MCELPARSIPGAEMVFVENPRIRCPALDIVTCLPFPDSLAGLGRAALLAAPDEDAVVAFARAIAERLVADLLRPRGDVDLGHRIARPDLDHATDGHAVHALLGLEQRARAGGAARVDDLVGDDHVQFGCCECHGVQLLLMRVVLCLAARFYLWVPPGA